MTNVDDAIEQAKKLFEKGSESVLKWLSDATGIDLAGLSTLGDTQEEGPTDEDVENSVLAQYLPVFVKRRKEREKINSYYNNIILFNTTNPARLKNAVNSFDPNEIEPIFNLTNLQLSNLVPEIRIFKVYKKKDSNSKNEDFLELELPFPNYTQRQEIQQILETRSGRGGGIGIQSFEWNSLAKNESNLAQFSAKLKIYLQDAGEILKVRNSTKDNNDSTYTVSIADLIYPTIKESGNLKGFEYDPYATFLKIKIGWNVNQSTIEDKNVQIDQKIVKLLTSEYYLSLTKHDLQFNPDGSLTVTIDFIAAAEGLSDNFGTSDILFAGFKNRATKQIEQRFEALKKAAKEEINSEKTTENRKRDIEAGLKSAKKKIELIEEKRSKRFIFKDFMTWLNQNKLIDYVSLKPEQVKSYKNLYDLDTKTLDVEDSLLIAKTIAAGQKQVSPANAEQIPLQQLEGIEAAATAGQSNEKEDEYKINEKEVTEAFIKSIKDKYEKEGKENGLIVPFFYLGDLFEYFTGVFLDNRFDPNLGTEKKADGNTGTLGYKNIGNKNVRLVLGTFTFSDFGNPQIQIGKGGVATATKKIKIGNETDPSQKTILLTGKTEIANIAHIPISIKNFSKWFNNKILDSNLEKLSYNRFVREVIYHLVPSNLSNQITRVTPKIRLQTLMNPNTIDDKAELIPGTSVINFLNQAHEKNYILDFDETHKDPGNNPFLHLKSKKSNYELVRPAKATEKNLKNYIFLFSANEVSSNFKRDYQLDLRNNIYHFYVGEETGMIKSIKFNREDNPRLDAHNIQAANKENSGKLIRQVYHADIEMFGNTLFEPGCNLFINPTYPGVKLGDPTLFSLGLGGYFTVIEVNSRIEGGLYTTSLKTKWQSFGIDLRELDEYKQVGLDEADLAQFNLTDKDAAKFI